MTVMTRPYSAANYNQFPMDKLIINIGRQFGSGGKCVAVEIGKKLDIKVYDNTLISKAAQESGFSQDFFRDRDEKRNLLSFFTMPAPYSNNSESYLSDNGLFKMQSSTIRNIAEAGSAIIVGRCSDYILRDYDCTLDVFITAPMKDRIKRVADRLEISEEKAESMIVKKDKNREAYYNYFTFGNWGVASNYDLCIDSSILGIEGTADFIIDFAVRSGLITK